MILRFTNRDTYSALVRLTRRVVVDIRVAHKSTTPSNNTEQKAIAAVISKQYNQNESQQQPKQLQRTTQQPSPKLSSIELGKLREVQKQVGFQRHRRRMNEKISLNSYLNVCVDVGQINRANNTLMTMNIKRPNQIVDVHHYNIILRGWARLSSLTQVLETRTQMIRNNIQPNAESFVYILLAYSKGDVKSHKTSIKRLLRQMATFNIDAKYLFQSTYVSPGEREQITRLLKIAEPKYEDQFFDEPIVYDCKLLQDFDKTPSVPYEFTGIDDMSQLESWTEHQRSVESKPSVSVKSVARVGDTPQQQERYAKLWQRLHEMWRQALSKALDDSLNELELQAQDSSKIHLYPYLCSLDRKMLLHILLDEIELNATYSSYSASTNTLHHELGRKVMIRYLRSKWQGDGSNQERQRIYNEYLKEYCTNAQLVSCINPRQYIQQKASETKNYAVYKDKLVALEEWPTSIVTSVGRFLYGLILREIKFDPESARNPKRDINMKNLVNAFYTAYFQVDKSLKIKEEFRAHQDFEQLQLRASAVSLRFDYSFLPCSSPPLPWLSRKFGGYLTNQVGLIRLSDPFEELTYMETSPVGASQKLYPSMDSLNAIGMCPWIVNKDMLDIVIGIFQSGGNEELKVPLNETQMSLKMPALKENPSKADRILYTKQKRSYDQKRREMYSLWRDCLYRLSIANHFRDKIFWFPHNMDFRGRTYPVPPHFNHLGADLSRSLLLFAKGRPLGPRGLDWLKLHAINLTGCMKKKSLAERLEYVNSILHLEILDSADNPLDGRGWWMQGDDPWQVLACCKEIARAIRSRDHTQYVSHLPIHQDGSCNGLQHYAALGRDPGGALAVNLIPSETPQDVYSRVLELVEKARRQDGDERALKTAKMLDGFVERKVIKQTVMTTVYGVTRYGARQQIARQLSAKGYNEREIWQAAQYLTSRTFDSIGQMFNKSRIIQDWFNECAYIIASKCRQPVSWETPLGLPVTQPYVTRGYTNGAMKNSSVQSTSDTSTPSLLIAERAIKLNMSKQKTAFPPNYIHSLDSSHMMLTSLYCQRQGITFVSVHDCYWTHPATVDAMNKICREQFIALHSEPLLQQLSDQFVERYGHLFDKRNSNHLTPNNKSENSKDDSNNNNNKTNSLLNKYESARQIDQARSMDKFREVPETGDLDLNLIKDSTYFFS